MGESLSAESDSRQPDAQSGWGQLWGQLTNVYLNHFRNYKPLTAVFDSRLATILPKLLIALLASACALLARADDATTLATLAKPGHVLFLRHANAPGFGDPPGFRIGDCATQRNLDAAGRAQARALGERLRKAGITKARVLSSEWCRCRETAELLGLGPVEAAPALNSFFGKYEEREARLKAVRALLAKLPRDAPPVVLVTHQVVITGLTGEGIGSGGGVVFRLEKDAPRVVGTLAAPPLPK